ncbi:hypothetical protein BVRB_2g031060 [Beta vulgaris subsp. vulgaris]|nr:hypothetical protein BVRB_2g031060 [Beta vulgaris subsp. vulgaris]
MAAAVLHPHDCLKRQPHHRRQLISPATNPNPNPNPRSNRRKRNSPPPPSQNGPTKAHHSRSRSPPVLGQVRILKRGEEISLPSPPPMMNPIPVNRSGSGPVPVPGPSIGEFFAGSAFVTSPSPSELPLPCFFTRRNCGEAHNQEIASELRRVLKLQI